MFLFLKFPFRVTLDPPHALIDHIWSTEGEINYDLYRSVTRRRTSLEDSVPIWSPHSLQLTTTLCAIKQRSSWPVQWSYQRVTTSSRVNMSRNFCPSMVNDRIGHLLPFCLTLLLTSDRTLAQSTDSVDGNYRAPRDSLNWIDNFGHGNEIKIVVFLSLIYFEDSALKITRSHCSRHKWQLIHSNYHPECA